MSTRCKISLYAAIISGFTFLLAVVTYSHYGQSSSIALLLFVVAMSFVYFLTNNCIKEYFVNLNELSGSVRDAASSEDFSRRIYKTKSGEFDDIINSMNNVLLKAEDNYCELKDAKSDLEEANISKDANNVVLSANFMD